MKKSLIVSLFLASMGMAATSFAAEQAPAGGETGEASFELERAYMVDDLTSKLGVLVNARGCAQRAENMDALRECSTELRREILRQQQEQRKKAN